MRKRALSMVVFAAAVSLFVALSVTSASAYPGFTSGCIGAGCHGSEGAAPVCTLVANNGTIATYSVAGPDMFEWAVFAGTSRVAGTASNGASGIFTVPVGATYTVFAVYGNPGNGDSGSSIAISPTGGTTNFTIVPTAGTNGSISPATAQAVATGADATFAITPAAGYHVADVLVDGVSVGAVSSHTFTNVTANHTISATFEVGTSTFTIVPSAGANGSISPAATQTIAAGADVTFTITPYAGYHIATVSVDGVAVSVAGTYRFADVAANHTISATFAVNAALVTITPSVVGGSGGAIFPSTTWTMASLSSITFYFAPADGYHVDKVLVDGAPVVLDPDDGTYTFSRATEDHTISVSFAVDMFTINATAGANGSISPAATQTVATGSDATFVITPASGYRVADVLVDGVSAGPIGTHTFTDVTADHTISASFAANVSIYTITPSVAGPGSSGSISPNTVWSMVSGSSITFDFTPSDGYEVDAVLVDGAAVTLTEDDAYTFAKVTEDHTISVSFVLKASTLAVTATAGTHGAISPSGIQTLNPGDDATFTITPDAGYHVLDVTVDGVSKGAVTTWTLSNVIADHAIAATFEADAVDPGDPIATTLTLKASAKSLHRYKYVTISSILSGGVPVGTHVRYQLTYPGKHAFVTISATRDVSATGVSSIRYKLTKRGTYCFRARFMGITGFTGSISKVVKVVVK